MTVDTAESETLAKASANKWRAAAGKPAGIVVLILLPSAGLFAWFIWPTAYRYDHMNVRGNIYPVRIERWSGRAAVMYPSGWKPVGAEEKLKTEATDLPSEQLALLETTGEWSYGAVFINLYNGSSFHVSQVIVELIIWEKATSDELLRRLYEADSYYSGPTVKPRSSSRFSFNPHFSIGADHAWSFRLVGARGYRSD